ncbi:MAG: carbohydrate kinase family protein [bacterium]|nr:carbohydrate kinase family protein [bacterium]
MKKVLSIGEATLDCFVFVKDAEVRCELNKKNCMFCVRYAEKILADKLVFTVGGNAANTAVSFSRLGLDSQLYSVIGDDGNGEMIQKSLKKDGVDLKYLQQFEGMTSFSTVIVFQGERSIIIYHEPREYHLPKLDPVDWVYLTSLGKDYPRAYEKVLDFVKKTGAKLSFNPGSFQLKDGVSAMKKYFAVTEALFVNKEEAMLLTELPASASIAQLSEALYDYGIKIVNITDGPNGAYCFDGHELLFQDIIPADVTQRTGCGDAYGAAFTAALLHGESIDEAMRWGMANAAGVVTKIGPQTGLLTKDQLREMLADYPKIVPKKVRR